MNFTGGLKSESTGGVFTSQKKIPNFYPKLLHPVHIIDKIFIACKIMQVKQNTTVMKTRYINESPYNKVLWWAIFIKHNLKFELGWAGLGMLWAV